MLVNDANGAAAFWPKVSGNDIATGSVAAINLRVSD